MQEGICTDSENKFCVLRAQLGSNVRVESIVRKMRGTILGGVSLCIFVVILFAGLRPFTAYPRNQVSWLENSRGLRFGAYAEIVSSAEFSGSRPREKSPCSLEIWLAPRMRNDTNTLLAFYTSQNPFQFRIRQSGDGLLLMHGPTAPDKVEWAEKIEVKHVLHDRKKTFLTITSTGNTTLVYVDGLLAGQSSTLNLTSKDLDGRLIVGKSPLENDSWAGELRGLAIYDNELDPNQIRRHYHLWTSGQHPEISPTEEMTALYTFEEGKGNVIYNRVKSSPNLYIPSSYEVDRHAVLKPFWREYHPRWSYYKSIAINIAGFIPLGFVFCIYLARITKLRRALLVTIVLGFAVSLVIEILQAYIPTRDSGMTDVITNTLGTTIGAELSENKLIITILDKVGL